MSDFVCPCCGQVVPPELMAMRDVAIRVVADGSSPGERRILNYLARHFGQRIPTSMLVDHLYSLDRGGGPDNAAQSARVLICRLRKKLKRVGLSVKGFGGRNVTGGGETLLGWAKR